MINSLTNFSLRPVVLGMRQIYIAGAAALILGLTGCGGTLSGAGPYKGAIEEKNDTYTLVNINATSLSPFIRGAQKPATPTIVSTVPAEVRLMGGDVINILITDNAPEGTALFAPLSTGGTQLKVRIDNKGMISLPYVGQQFVAGMTPIQVENMIRQRLKGVTSDVQAHVDLVGDLSGSVLVAGAVKSPGRFSTLQGPLTILDAVNQAGGPVLEPHLVSVTIRNGTIVKTLNYEEILAGNNATLSANSEVILERARQRFVAMGAVGQPGLHDFPQQYTSLLDALGTVGGLKENAANAQGVFIFRANNDSEKPTVLQIDMRDPAAIFYARQIMLRPDDTIYVTNSAVYEWQKIISPIVQTIVLGRAVGSQ